MRTFSRSLLTFGLSLLFFTTPAFPQSGSLREVGRLVAVVDDTPITSQELSWRVQQVQHMLSDHQKLSIKPQEIRKKVLDAMITEQLQVNYGHESGLTASDEEIDATIKKTAQRKHMTEKEMIDRWTQSGSPASEFRKEIRNQLLLEKVRQRVLKDIVQLTPDQIMNFIQQHKNDKETQIEFQHIFIPFDHTPDHLKKAQEKVKQVIDAFHSGRNFDSLVLEFSQAPDVSQKGMIGWRYLSSFPEQLKSSLDHVAIGDIAQPVQTEWGFDVLLVKGKRIVPSPFGASRKVKLQMIVVWPQKAGSSAERTAKELRRRIVAGKLSFMKAAETLPARMGNRDSAQSHWVAIEELPPPLEKVVSTLKANAVSPAFSDNGRWYLLRWTDDNSNEIPLEQQKLVAQRLLIEQHGNEEYANWIRTRRESSYIKIFE